MIKETIFIQSTTSYYALSMFVLTLNINHVLGRAVWISTSICLGRNLNIVPLANVRRLFWLDSFDYRDELSCTTVHARP